MPYSIPPNLQSSDKVKIVASASRIPNGNLDYAIRLLSSWGLNVKMDPSVMLKEGMFAGSDMHRLQSVQNALDDKHIRAIFFARGGYGSLRILEELNWDEFLKNPKWLVGFSDVCTFHLLLNNTLNCASLHAGMPIQFEGLGADHPSVASIKEFLFTGSCNYSFKSSAENVFGDCTGKISGGNLAIIYSLLFDNKHTDFRDKILFIEEIGEYHYAIDRMLKAMRLSGRFEKIKGILVGDFSSLKESNLAFERSIPEIVKDIFCDLNIPMAFNIPVGHEKLNLCLPLNLEMSVNISSKNVLLKSGVEGRPIV